ncbi:MAG: helix-turn-helix domain-containing protein [Chloroflexota bacterium]
MTAQPKQSLVANGEADFAQWRDEILADPARRAHVEELIEQKELALQLQEARQNSGLSQQELAQRIGVSQAQVARMEKRGYDAYTLTSLRRYLAALGSEYRLEVRVQRAPNAP